MATKRTFDSVSVYGETSIKELNDNDYNDEQNEEDNQLMPYAGNANNLLCVFNEPVAIKRRKVTCVDIFEYNLKRGNTTLLHCDTPGNDLVNLLASLKYKLNLDEWLDRMLPEPHAKIVVTKPVAPRVVYQVGFHVHGGKVPFYFFDTVYLRRYSGKHGEFFTARWSSMATHNAVYANIIKRYNSWDDQLKMQDSIIVRVPGDDQPVSKLNFVKTFFDIRSENNRDAINTSENATTLLSRPLSCEMFNIDMFNEIFQFNQEGSEQAPSDEVKMYMFAVIEGFKEGKNEIEMETVNNKKIKEKPLSLAIQPLVFFKMDEM
ncbi:DNA binding protein [Clanis bilineata nucleopolyhedrovirus]|uniref:DNA binding protein n=1 Tax=Clanis bilineata nucleopolyhedrovirus TaxID=1307957 RepID=Q0N472_9ABAC|nr:DNA binding protein [Clanis bilineata nucleopolyhedrovirus]ABF47371.1 DNA binding protein [Clanis bilineata nucleopolyhedrovirus]